MKPAIEPGLDFTAEVDVTGLGTEPSGLGDVTGLADAIRSAKEFELTTYLVESGRQVAAIVPVKRSTS